MLDKNLEKIQKLLSFLDDEYFTKEEFLKQFEEVVKFIKKVEARNIKAIDDLEKTFKALSQKLKADHSLSIADVKKIVTAQIDTLNGKYANLEQRINAKLAEVRNGENGKDADEARIIEAVKSQIKIPEVREIENDLPKLGAPIRDALELLQGEERLEMSAVKGLEDKLKEVETKKGTSFGGLQNTVRYYDLSSQLNGTLKEFYVPTHRVAVQLIGTEFPIVYRPSTDFTTAKNTLTLTDEVSAPAQGQSLLFLYVK